MVILRLKLEDPLNKAMLFIVCFVLFLQVYSLTLVLVREGGCKPLLIHILNIHRLEVLNHSFPIHKIYTGVVFGVSKFLSHHVGVVAVKVPLLPAALSIGTISSGACCSYHEN
jgi:hypothetical protein